MGAGMTSFFVKPAVAVPETTGDDPRVGHLLGRKLADGAAARVVIIGFPTDEGVKRNGGRPGAADGSSHIRRHFARMTPDPTLGAAFVDLLEHTLDLGDLPVSPDLDDDQQRLGDAVAEELRRGAFVIVLGGGHETAYGHFLGYVRTRKAVSIINWDAHPDVRELKNGHAHSGSPFRQALLHKARLCRGYTAAGLLPHTTAAAHLRFLEQRKANYLWRHEISSARIERLYSSLRGPTMVSFDIDAVDQAFAPGVSAPATGGLSVDLWLEAAYQAGRSPRVSSCDLVELAPAFDPDGKTARLCALTIWQILRGFSERPSSSAKPRARRLAARGR